MPDGRPLSEREDGVPSPFSAASTTPVFVDGIGPPLQQIAEDYADFDSGMGDDIRALIEAVYRLRAGLEDLLSVAERARGGDPSLDPEEWFAARDYARSVLSVRR